MNKKIWIGAILAFDALSATMGSSIFSAATRPIEATFHVSQEVATLGTSLFVLGYAFGPIVWYIHLLLIPFLSFYSQKFDLLVSYFSTDTATKCHVTFV